MLDRLPIKLINILFKHFSAQEILSTFAEINPHFKQIVDSYHDFRVNLKSIQKCDFDLICRRIRPEQVVELTLSDDCDTPGQSQLFFSRFSISQFVNLQSLRLISISPETLQSIVFDLSKLVQLRNLSLKDFNLCDDDSTLAVDDFSKANINTLIRLQPKRILTSFENDRHSVPMNCLTHFEMDYKTSFLFDTIRKNSPRLESLIAVFPTENDLKSIASCKTIKKLQISLSGRSIQMESLETCLANLPNLEHLQIRWDHAPVDVCDADRWQSMTTSLVSFKFLFDFTFELSKIKGIVNRFRTSFWLDEKDWLVGYHYRSLFSLSFPNLSNILVNSHHPIVATSPCRNFPNRIQRQSLALKEFRWTTIEDAQSQLISLRNLSVNIDFTQIQHLTVNKSSRYVFEMIPDFMPNLRSLAVPSEQIDDFLVDISGLTLNQIRTFRSTIGSTDFDYNLRILADSFPSLEHFGIVIVKSLSQIDSMLKKFPKISSLTLKTETNVDDGSFIDLDEMFDRIKRLTKKSVMQKKCKRRSVEKFFQWVHVWFDHR